MEGTEPPNSLGGRALDRSGPVIILGGTDGLTKERAGYFASLSQLGEVRAVELSARSSALELLELHPELLIHASLGPVPRDLQRVPFPTVGLFIDSYNGTSNQARFAELFDYAFVFHPSSISQFLARGHSGVHLLPHAADHRLFAKHLSQERSLEIGWVGVSRGVIYSRRRRCLELLASQFVMNPWREYYSSEELASVYGKSKIVVNVSRDDYPEDANLRCFEAFAAGAALVTTLPTELSELGFRNGKHFVGVENVTDIPRAARELLDDEQRRMQIAMSGHELFVSSHTYDHRARRLLEVALTGSSKAPIRSKPAGRLHEDYAFWYAKHGCVAEAIAECWASGALARNVPVRPLWWTARAIVARYLRH
jgi:hypothetical protein